MAHQAQVDKEVLMIVEHIKRLGKQRPDGQWVVPFGVLIKDDKVGNTLEAPVGTLKAAKRKKILNYESELLLSPTHDKVEIVLAKDA